MASSLWRVLVIAHRYLGIAVGALMLMWFASGVVMMYVGFPQGIGKERLGALAPIAWFQSCPLPNTKSPARAGRRFDIAMERQVVRGQKRAPRRFCRHRCGRIAFDPARTRRSLSPLVALRGGGPGRGIFAAPCLRYHACRRDA